MQFKKIVPLALALTISTTAAAGAANLDMSKFYNPTIFASQSQRQLLQRLCDRFDISFCGQQVNCPVVKPDNKPEQTPDETPDQQPEETPEDVYKRQLLHRPNICNIWNLTAVRKRSKSLSKIQRSPNAMRQSLKFASKPRSNKKKLFPITRTPSKPQGKRQKNHRPRSIG